ncbi:MAG: CPBP family intramembrane glutamic endopeptidase, partial [Planctomycetota bacterium]
AHPEVHMQAPADLRLDQSCWAVILSEKLLWGGVVVSLLAATAWFAIPEARAWLRPRLERTALRTLPAARLCDVAAVFMVYFSAARVLLLDLLPDGELRKGELLAWSMLINGAAMFLALTFGISLARQHVHGFHGSNGVWPFWRLDAANPRRSLWRDIALGILAYPLMLWAMNLAVWVNREFVQSLDLKTELHPLVPELAAPQPGWVLLVFFVMGTVGAAFLEELLFRGILYNALRRYLGATAGACAAALLFAASHPDWSQILGLFLLALVLTWLYDYTGRLAASMTLHALNNLVALILALSAQRHSGG